MEMDELLGQAAVAQVGEERQEDAATIEVTAHRRRRHKHGRNSIPEELIKEVIVDVSESEKICGCCQKPMVVIDKKSHLVVEREPAKWSATRFTRLVYSCSDCKDGITVAAPPVVTPIPKGLAWPALCLRMKTAICRNLRIAKNVFLANLSKILSNAFDHRL